MHLSRLTPALVTLLLWATAFPLPAEDQAPTLAAPPLQVVTLSPVLDDLARTIGGPRVTVHNLASAGVDHHSFEPTAADIARVTQAQLVIASGLGLEGYLPRLRSATPPSVRWLVAGEAVPQPLELAPSSGHEGHHHHDHDHDHAHDHHHHNHDESAYDPHWWHSLAATSAVAQRLADTLAELDPAHASGYQERAAALRQALAQTQTWAQQRLAAIPPERRQLLTLHDAWGYFCQEYQFQPLFIADVEGAEPSPQAVAALIAKVRALPGGPVLFLEDATDPRLAQALRADLTGLTLGGTLLVNGPNGVGDTATVVGAFRHNVETIAQALSPAGAIPTP